jgi:hypothetical protein
MSLGGKYVDKNLMQKINDEISIAIIEDASFLVF